MAEQFQSPSVGGSSEPTPASVLQHLLLLWGCGVSPFTQCSESLGWKAGTGVPMCLYSMAWEMDLGSLPTDIRLGAA